MINERIPRTINEGDQFAATELAQPGHQGVPRQFSFITAAKFDKSLRAMAEPKPQLRARGNIFHPAKQVSRRFLDASRPQSINQYA